MSETQGTDRASPGDAAGASGLPSVLARNIDVLRRSAEEERRSASWPERSADVITRFTGSMAFVFLHLAVFGFWIVVNLRLLPFVPVWDESFVMLAMVASVEAIFLSTFVLISQNRMATLAEKRADLDLQINLLTEHEITRLAHLLLRIAEKLGVEGEELSDVKEHVPPEAVLEQIERGH